MSGHEIEVQVTFRVREALRAAEEKVGRKEFASLAGITEERLGQLVDSTGDYVAVTVVTVACQVNKSHGDKDHNHSSINQCLKGAAYRIPKPTSSQRDEAPPPRQIASVGLKENRARVTGLDQKSLRLINFSANIITFIALGYFLGGLALAPAVGLPACVGIVPSSPWLSPCLGSVLGIAIGAVAGLAYTTYYFIKKM